MTAHGTDDSGSTTAQPRTAGAEVLGTAEPTEAMWLEVLELRDLLAGAQAEAGELSTRLLRLDAQRDLSEQMWQVRLAETERQLDAAVADARLAREQEAATREHYESRIAEMEASTSWRIGRAVVVPLAALRRRLGGR